MRLNEKQTSNLSHQESQVLTHATAGTIDKEIAARMGISLGTVRVYWKRIRVKMNGATRSEVLVAFGRAEVDQLRKDKELLTIALVALEPHLMPQAEALEKAQSTIDGKGGIDKFAAASLVARQALATVGSPPR